MLSLSVKEYSKSIKICKSREQISSDILVLLLILGSLLLSEPSDQLFVVLKTSGNAHTLLYIDLLSNLFVTNTID